jgi:hypothetical protein
MKTREIPRLAAMLLKLKQNNLNTRCNLKNVKILFLTTKLRNQKEREYENSLSN